MSWQAVRARGRRLRRAHAGRARPRDDDRARRDADRRARRRRHAAARAPGGEPASCLAWHSRRSGSSRTGASACSASSTPGATPSAPASRRVQAMIGLGSGGIFGDGLGESVGKLIYLPEAHTDMIFAIVGEELGLVGTPARARRLLRLRVRRLPHRAALPRSVRQASGRGADDARLRPGARQPRGGARARAADRHSAPVRVGGRVEPRRGASSRRHPP